MYFGQFTCIEDVIDQFRLDESALEGVAILVAAYDTGDYDGSAMVVFRKSGKLYEVNGSHCSCNGLEECWSPEETSYEALMFRIERGDMRNGYGDAFVSALAKGLVDELFDKEVLLN